MQVNSNKKIDRSALAGKCLAAFIASGTLELSLDQLSSSVGISKRMLIHYFGGREAIEEASMTLLEERLRTQFAPKNFPAGIELQTVLDALWSKTTEPQSRGVLLLVMELTRRAWNGSERAKAFYAEQQRLWVELLLNYLPDRRQVEDILQCFQGAVMTYLVTGDADRGMRAIDRLCAKRVGAKPPMFQTGRKAGVALN